VEEPAPEPGGVPKRSRASALAGLLAAAAVLVAGVGQVHERLLQRDWEARATARLARRLAAIEERSRRIVGLLQTSADRVAALPETRAALGRERTALAKLFHSLETLSDSLPERPALAVHSLPFSTMAWAGRVADLRGIQAMGSPRRGLFVLSGSVTTLFVATAPVAGPGGRPLGLGTAELAVRVHRNLSNQYLRDFDLILGDDPDAEIHYVDVRDPSPDPFPPKPPGVVAQEHVLRGPDGVLALVRLTARGPQDAVKELALRYRQSVSGLACAALLVWTLAGNAPRLRRRGRLVLGASALRLVCLWLGPPLPPPGSSLLDPDVFASTLLGPFLKSPLDLWLTAAWAALLGGLLVLRVLPRAPAEPSLLRAVGSGLLSVPVIGATFAILADVTANSSRDLDTISLIPKSAAHLTLQTALLLVLAGGACLLISVLSLAGPFPPQRSGQALRWGTWLVLGLVVQRFWPRDLLGLPLVPVIALFVGAGLLAGTHPRWRRRLAAAGAGARAGLAVIATFVLALLLYPSVAHFAEKNRRVQIEQEYAPFILRQPEWRRFVLAESQREIDSLGILEDSLEGPSPPGVDELAFSIWSATDLASSGLSAAVEIQDPTGTVISRFALNLSSLSRSGASRPLPPNDGWKVHTEKLTLFSVERPVLHARRLVVTEGKVRGAIHLYVADDFSNLPFASTRDPYSLLFRSGSHSPARDENIRLLAYDEQQRIVFSSAEQPPALRADLLARLRRSPGGFWTTLVVDGRPYHTFLFADDGITYGLAYPRLGASRYVAELVEAGAAMGFLALLVLLVVVLVRTVLRAPTLSLPSMIGAVRRHFALRLFVAFVAVGIVPVTVLEVVVRGLVARRLRTESEEQALERAAVAKKAVEDFAITQRGETPLGQPVTDALLVWVASLIRNDLDLFAGGRLLASSKRELFASGLLPARVPGAVFRALILEGMPSVIRTETIGTFSTLVVSVPVRLNGPEPGILSIPLALREQEVKATLDDLDRTIRLASVAFLLLAAAFAHSMSRRISGPIRELTEATRRVAHGQLDTRVTTASRDELHDLVVSFNQMAGDLARQREDLERSNRLAAWAEMARQVAHEVKNPLTPIQLSAEHLRRVFRDRGPDFAATLEACTATILKQVRSLREIVTEFSAFARPPASELRPQDLAAIVEDVLRPYRVGLPPGVSLSLDVEPGLPVVTVDRRLLERATVNLIENALQAVGDRGQIVVRLGRSADPPDRVELEVRDSGPGVDPEVRHRIFEPFFSTKTSGSGLGLAIVKKIAEDHGGGVSLESTPGAPTRAILWLPVDGTPPGTARETAPSSPGPA
jgi:signal transduction histidine kinase